ncbi:salicylate hydroxylase, partial [Paraburkholderia sp. SIMBA_009]
MNAPLDTAPDTIAGAAANSACPASAAPEQPLSFMPPWQGDGSHRIPFGVYTDAALHQRELERFFYR